MKTLKNAMAAIEMIADSEQPVPVVDISKTLGIPRSSASRLMSSLRDGGLVEQDPKTRRYVPGLLAWRFAARHWPFGYDGVLVSEALVNVSVITGFTTWMAVLNGSQTVLLRQHQGHTPAQFSVRVGQALPAHATAVGKALLSRLPERAVQTLYGERMERLTAQTIVNKTDLYSALRDIRERKIAVSDQEAFPGVVSVGGAVYGAASNYPIGLSVSFPATAAKTEKVSRLLYDELSRIGRSVGDRAWL